ncbi:MAG: hypothetical protein MJA28_12550 [Gammaproteobacteria bacterium]|nr:hypothetical protein [Gammaproteobacteria bacterium]
MNKGRTLSGFALACVAIATLIDQLSGGFPIVYHVANAAMLVYVALEIGPSPMMTKVMIAFAIVLAALLWPHMTSPWAVVEEGIAFGAFLSTFFVALGFVRAASDKSKRIKLSGRHLLTQPPSRRYLALTVGSNLFGLILSIGVLNLLGSMVKKSNTLASVGGSVQTLKTRERRSLMAIQRGFSMVPAWSPLSISVPIVLLAIPSLSWEQLVPAALAAVILLLLLGWLDDRITFRGRVAPPYQSDGPPLNWTVHLPFLLLIGAIFGSSVMMEKALDTRMVVGMMTCAPIAALIWMLMQSYPLGRKLGCAWMQKRLITQMTETFPRYRIEIIVMFSAGFYGVLIKETLPPTLIADAIAYFDISVSWLPLLVFLMIIVMANLTLHPMLSVIILSTAMPTPESLGISPISMGLAYLSGWGVGVSTSPYTICNLIVAQVASKTAHQVAYQWNGRYILSCTLLGGIGLYLLA